MRVAMISEHASPLAALGGEDAGGQNTHVAELSTALARQGHEVRVYTRRDSPAQPDEVVTAAGFTVVHVPAGPPVPVPKDALLPYMDGFGRWLGDAWRDGGWRPDAAHAHFWMSGLAAIAARRRTGVPVVQTYHALGTVKRRHQGGADTSPAGRIRHEVVLGGGADRVIAQSRDETDELRRMGVPAERISLIPSGVDSHRFAPVGPAEPGRPGRPRIVTVGRLVERKGFADLVRALPAVPDAECVVVGGPPQGGLAHHRLARELRELAGACRVGDRLRLAGAVPPARMARWYRSADLVALAPWYEPFGLAALEAMACGVPVVATAVGGLTDTVVDGVTGELVPPRDPDALGGVLRGLLGDPARRAAYGAAGADRARRHYSWRRTADRLAGVYAAVSHRMSEVVA
jgi:glycosyltransferase involved in cell wall biosynthesis